MYKMIEDLQSECVS